MKKNNFLIEKPAVLLNDFLKNYQELYDIDLNVSNALIKDTILYYNKGGVPPSYVKILQEIWYKSLKKSFWHPDYSVYNDRYYFTDLWACFHLYSRKYLMSIMKNNSYYKGKSIYDLVKKSKTVVDLGCGIGYTTAMLSQMFPDAKILGTNLKTTEQYKFCKKISKMYNFKINESINELKNPVDLIFASEYYEHIYNAPINLYYTLKNYKPKYLLLANSFNTYSVGHFKKYLYRPNINKPMREFISEKQASKIFNNVLISMGYEKKKTNLWNNKPNLWVKK